MAVLPKNVSDIGPKAASDSALPLRGYFAYGLSIHSELPLPLPALPERMHPALFDIEIRSATHSLVSVIPEAVRPQRNLLSPFDFAQLPDGSSYVRWDDVGEVLIPENGRCIVCRPFEQTAWESFYVYLLGQALSFALVKNGFEPLHATAVVIEDEAVAFLGDCGFGKSTLAAAFLQAGHRLLTDDLLLLRRTGSQILAYPGPARIKLFPEMIRMLPGEEELASGVQMNPNTQKLIIPLERNQICANAVPLRAIYALSSPHDVTRTGIRIESLTKREGFFALLGSTFNRMIVDAGRLRRQFDATQGLANDMIVRRLCYPRTVACLHLVRQAILCDLYPERSKVAACEA